MSFLLLLARLCLYLQVEGGTLDQLAATLAKLRQEVAIANVSQSKSINEINLNMSDLKSRFKASAESLVSHYMKVQSGKISTIISKSLDSLPPAKDKGPRAGMEAFLDEIKIMAADLSGVFDVGGSSSSSAGADTVAGPAAAPADSALPVATSAAVNKPTMMTAQSQAGPTAGTKAAATVASASAAQPAATSKALFEKKIALSSDVMEFSKSSILTDIVKICIKSFVEFVRLKTFSKVAFQQVQLDAYFLRIALGNFVNTKGIVGLLLDEVVTSATDRCTEPAPMEQSSMWMLCEPKLEKYKTPQKL